MHILFFSVTHYTYICTYDKVIIYLILNMLLLNVVSITYAKQKQPGAVKKRHGQAK